ncbi:hypothetical protein BGX28_000088 [Mortierella sp. GBA30]|nr:hypothetical protein BGX28_000088 [Mortierella sp. GBA30]
MSNQASQETPPQLVQKDLAMDADALCAHMNPQAQMNTTDIVADGYTKTEAIQQQSNKEDHGLDRKAVSSCCPTSDMDMHALAVEKHEEAPSCLPAVTDNNCLRPICTLAPHAPALSSSDSTIHPAEQNEYDDPCVTLSPVPNITTTTTTATEAADTTTTTTDITAIPALSSLTPSSLTIAADAEPCFNAVSEQAVVLESERLSFSSKTISTSPPSSDSTHIHPVYDDKPLPLSTFTNLEARRPVHNSISFMSSTSSSSSLSSSSLSEYLIIGQDQVESESDDQQSERSYASSSDNSQGSSSFYGSGSGDGGEDHDIEGGEISEASQDSQNEEHGSEGLITHNHNQNYHHNQLQQQRPRHRSSRQQLHNRQHEQQAFSDGHPTEYEQERQFEYKFVQHRQQQQQEEQQQCRIAESAPKSADGEDERSSASSSSSTRASSPTSEKTRFKRRSHRSSQKSAATSSSSSSASTSANTDSKESSTTTTSPPLPALKIPSLSSSLGGLSKSIFEFMIASVVCISLLSCMFAFSYVSTGTKHLLGWYADQHIAQKIRDGIKEREHFVQEALEKMAGDEYVKVKRRSRQQQHQQQQQQQHHQQNQQHNPHYAYQSRYQQQYQQQREQRQQQEQQQKQQQHRHRQDEYERGRLSTAEWQELIRAASMSFMAKFTASPTATSRGTHRR